MPERYLGPNRRRQTRTPFWATLGVREIIPIEMRVHVGDGREVFATSLNMSSGGVYLESFERYKPGAVLMLAFSLSGEENRDMLRFLGKVTHSEKIPKSSLQRVGVKFLRRSRSSENFFKKILLKKA